MFNGNKLDQDKTLSELDIKNDSIIFVDASHVCYCISLSYNYFLKDAKKKEKKYIIIKFIKYYK